MNFDSILSDCGEYGKYQKLVIWYIILPGVFPCGFHAYNQLFMAATPDHWCYVPELQGIEEKYARNISIPLEKSYDGQIRYSQCKMYNISTYDYLLETKALNIPNVHLDNKEIHSCLHGWVFDNIHNQTTISTEWNIVCSYANTMALVLFGASGLIGNYFFGYIQDRMGRKPAFFIYLSIQCFFGIATAFANNFTIWLLFRIGVGFTIPAILGTPYVLAIEIVGPKFRTMVIILINIAYSLSLIVLAVIVWVVRDWRTLAIVTTAPFFTLFSFLYLLPESPRWLISQERYQEAKEILEKIARVNEKELPKNYATILQHRSETIKRNESKTKSFGVRHLFKNKNLRWKTIIITFIWFTNTSVYVGLSYYAPVLGGNEFLNFFLAGAVELPTYLFLWPAMEGWGRRWSLCISMIIGGLACITTFTVQNDSLLTLVLYCIGKMGISSSFVVLPLMASELYPTVVRGLGMSISSVVGMLGPVFIPMVNYLGTNMLTLPLIVMGTMLVLGGACSLLLPETLNKSLPQTLDDAEENGLENPFCFLKNQSRENIDIEK